MLEMAEHILDLVIHYGVLMRAAISILVHWESKAEAAAEDEKE